MKKIKELFKKLFSKKDKVLEEQLRDRAWAFTQKNFPKMIRKWVAEYDEAKSKK